MHVRESRLWFTEEETVHVRESRLWFTEHQILWGMTTIPWGGHPSYCHKLKLTLTTVAY